MRSVSRRDFLKLISAGALGLIARPRLAGALDKLSRNLDGSFASDVVQCYDANATTGSTINQPIVQVMMDESIKALTGKTEVGEAWKSIFPGVNETSIIGIKINAVASCPTHPAVATSIVNGLAMMDFSGNLLPKNNVIIWDRLNSEITTAGYTIYTGSDPATVRCFGTNQSGVGYDSSVPLSVYGSSQNPSKVLTQYCDYIIDAAVLKTHSSAVVTLCLKNHYGSVHNASGLQHSSGSSSAVPSLNQQIRDVITPNNIQKLFIIDGLFGLYSGGPGGSPNFNPKYILMSRDIVACDKQGQNVINTERALHSLSPLNAAQITNAAGSPYNLGSLDINLIELNTTTGVEQPKPGAHLDGIVQVSPDPFRDRAEITLSLSRPSQVSIDLVNAAGRTEAGVYHGRLAKGRHQLTLAPNRLLPGGSYFLRFQGPTGSRVRRVTVAN